MGAEMNDVIKARRVWGMDREGFDYPHPPMQHYPWEDAKTEITVPVGGIVFPFVLDEPVRVSVPDWLITWMFRPAMGFREKTEPVVWWYDRNVIQWPVVEDFGRTTIGHIQYHTRIRGWRLWVKPAEGTWFRTWLKRSFRWQESAAEAVWDSTYRDFNVRPMKRALEWYRERYVKSPASKEEIYALLYCDPNFPSTTPSWLLHWTQSIGIQSRKESAPSRYFREIHVWERNGARAKFDPAIQCWSLGDSEWFENVSNALDDLKQIDPCGAAYEEFRQARNTFCKS